MVQWGLVGSINIALFKKYSTSRGPHRVEVELELQVPLNLHLFLLRHVEVTHVFRQIFNLL